MTISSWFSLSNILFTLCNINFLFPTILIIYFLSLVNYTMNYLSLFYGIHDSFLCYHNNGLFHFLFQYSADFFRFIAKSNLLLGNFEFQNLNWKSMYTWIKNWTFRRLIPSAYSSQDLQRTKVLPFRSNPKIPFQCWCLSPQQKIKG